MPNTTVQQNQVRVGQIKMAEDTDKSDLLQGEVTIAAFQLDATNVSHCGIPGIKSTQVSFFQRKYRLLKIIENV